jgi:hypothetical protein
VFARKHRAANRPALDDPITEPEEAWFRQPEASSRRPEARSRSQPEEQPGRWQPGLQRQELQQPELRRQELQQQEQLLPSWRKQRATATMPERRGSSSCSCEQSPQCDVG